MDENTHALLRIHLETRYSLSCYIRVWIGRTVWIADSQEGFKRGSKATRRFKIIFGIRSDL
ncbi:DUF3977 family protein [Paenibacillus sp. FSL R7-0204]|uniref:DUF3977 family protein n=1 Tax=Paenibacillus sp. FSL R7-0204 TaxID=2921675 RepID=UPI004046AA00